MDTASLNRFMYHSFLPGSSGTGFRPGPVRLTSEMLVNHEETALFEEFSDRCSPSGAVNKVLFLDDRLAECVQIVYKLRSAGIARVLFCRE